VKSAHELVFFCDSAWPRGWASGRSNGQVVNGLRAKALDAFGDGSTQFATQLAYDLGVQLGIARGAPPVPALFVPPAAPAPVPGPGIAPAAAAAPAAPAVAVPTAATPAAATPPAALPDDATIDAMDVDAVLHVIAPIVPAADQQEFQDLANTWGELVLDAKDEMKATGGIKGSLRKKMEASERTIKETAKAVIQEYKASPQPVTPPASPTASPSTSPTASRSAARTATPIAPTSVPMSPASTPHPLLATRIPSAPVTLASVAGLTPKMKEKKTGVEVKMPPEVRVDGTGLFETVGNIIDSAAKRPNSNRCSRIHC